MMTKAEKNEIVSNLEHVTGILHRTDNMLYAEYSTLPANTEECRTFEQAWRDVEHALSRMLEVKKTIVNQPTMEM